MASARLVFARLIVVALAMLMIPPPALAVIDPETYPPCSNDAPAPTTAIMSAAAGCVGIRGGGPSPTLLCTPGYPKDPFLQHLLKIPTPFAPPPSPNAAGIMRGCEFNPVPTLVDCPGGAQPVPPGLFGQYWPNCAPITMPTQLMSHTAFWDDESDTAFILGGSSTPGGGAASSITRFRRGMEIDPWPHVMPHAPGGTMNPTEYPSPTGLPQPGTCQALAWDPVGRVAYLFGGWNGAPSDEVGAFYPDTNTAQMLTNPVTGNPVLMPENLTCMAGTWNPTVTPNCPRGCAYMFGGRYPLPVDQNGTPPPNAQNPWGCGGTTDRMFLFDPVSMTVKEVPWKLPWTYFGMTAVPVGPDIYLFGGVHIDDSIAQDPNSAYNANVYACDPIVFYGLSPPLPNTGLPAQVGNCDIYRFSILEGGTLTRVNPYTLPSGPNPAGPSPWATGGNFCAGLRSGAIFDGRWIFIQMGTNIYKLDPFRARPDASAVPPVTVAQGNWPIAGACNTVTVSNCFLQMPFVNPGGTVKSPIGLRNLGFNSNYAVFTGCSAYWFGGLISPIVPQPNGPLSDKVAWLGKCRPKAILESHAPTSCVGWPVRLDGSKSIAGEASIYWAEWNFGDGSATVGNHWQPIWDLDPLSTNLPPYIPPFASYSDHKYETPGSYFATLTITDLSGFRETSPPVHIKVRSDATCKAYTGTDPTTVGVRPGPAEPGDAIIDSDFDGVPDVTDNCAGIANNDQEDINLDGIGDVCQDGVELTAVFVDPSAPVRAKMPDVDRDGVADDVDNCLTAANNKQGDVDGDKRGDACDEDIDGDTIPNDGPSGSFFDNCPSLTNPDQADTNGNGIGDACTLEEDAAPKGTVAPVHGNARDDQDGTPWTTTMTMVILAGLATAAVLTLVLRRGLRKE